MMDENSVCFDCKYCIEEEEPVRGYREYCREYSCDACMDQFGMPEGCYNYVARKRGFDD